MPIVEITGWSPGFQKVSCTSILHSVAGLGLAEAKNVTDAILDGHTEIVELPSAALAQQLVKSLQQLGASAHVVPAV